MFELEQYIRIRAVFAGNLSTSVYFLSGNIAYIALSLKCSCAKVKFPDTVIETSNYVYSCVKLFSLVI